jgi:hypothetical protein
MEMTVPDGGTFCSSLGGPSRRRLATSTWTIQQDSIEYTTASTPQIRRAEARARPGGGIVPYTGSVVHHGLQLRLHAKPGLGPTNSITLEFSFSRLKPCRPPSAHRQSFPRAGPLEAVPAIDVTAQDAHWRPITITSDSIQRIGFHGTSNRREHPLRDWRCR